MSTLKNVPVVQHPLWRSVEGLTLMIDNYDSFTYNIVQYLAELGANVQTIRNDALTLEQIIALNPTRLVISPGPGDPSSAGVSKAAIRHFAGRIPVLGVCLGHQSMIEEFGGKIVQAPCIIPDCFEVTATSVELNENLRRDWQTTAANAIELTVIQGVCHKVFTMSGLQFHPESITTEHGYRMFANFLTWTGGVWKQ